MTPIRSLARVALGGAAVLAVALPAPTASAAKRAPSEALYEVTFRAEMKDQWQAREYMTDDCQLTGSLCIRDEKGDGVAKLSVKTKRPFTMLVMRGAGGRGPAINVGTGEGAPVAGPYLRSGAWTTTYSGPWDAANPDRKADDDGCGTRTLTGDVNFTWRGRNQLGLSPILDDVRENCPTGSPTGWEWEGGDGPSLMDVVGQVDQNKFLRTKQFTVRASKSWKGLVPPFSRADKQGSYVKDGTRAVSWSWEATFRMKGTKRRRR